MNVWVTTANGQSELSKQTPLAFSTNAPSYETVVVDSTRTFQTMTGFGGSITDSSAYLLYTLPQRHRSSRCSARPKPSTPTSP